MRIVGYILIIWVIYDVSIALYKLKKGLDFHGKSELFRVFKKELFKLIKGLTGDLLILIYVIYHLIS